MKLINTSRFSRRSQAGVTLVELMVSAVMMVLVIGAAMAAFLSQNRVHQERLRVRQTRDAARTAITIIDQHLARAGFGIGPELAFLPVDENGALLDEVQDNIDEPDELIFHARSLRYFAAAEPDGPGPVMRGDAWEVDSAAINNVTLTSNGSPGTLEAGRVLLLLCPQAFTYTYVTVADAVNLDETDEGEQFNVALRTADGDDPLRQNNALNETCFSGGAARAFAIDRYRFYIDDIGDRPYLMLDRGLAGVGPQVVAADIEDLQVVYITRNGTEWGGANGDPASDLDLGDLGTASCPQAREITHDFYKTRAIAPCGLNTDRRQEDHIGNIRQVRVSVVARTPRPVRGDRGEENIDPLHTPSAFSTENHDRTNEDPDAFRRHRLTTTIHLSSMDARGIPSI